MTLRRSTLVLALGLVSAFGCKTVRPTLGPGESAAPAANAPAPAPAPVVTATTPPEPELPAVTKSGTKLTWLGHAAFRIDTPAGKVLFIDPWITNPKNPTGKDDLAKIDRADLVLVTHGHSDHVGDAVAIAKKTKAKLVSTFDVGRALVSYAGYPKDLVGMDTQGNMGGELSLLDGEVSIRFVPAVHSSTVQGPKEEPLAAGSAGGFLVSIKDGPTIYHTGDTDLFSDMALVPHGRPVTVMLAAIGDHFVMGPARAAEAVGLVRPAIVVPMHYGTFPVLTGTPEELGAAMKERGLTTKLEAMTPHQTLEL